MNSVYAPHKVAVSYECSLIKILVMSLFCSVSVRSQVLLPQFSSLIYSISYTLFIFLIIHWCSADSAVPYVCVWKRSFACSSDPSACSPSFFLLASLFSPPFTPLPQNLCLTTLRSQVIDLKTQETHILMQMHNSRLLPVALGWKDPLKEFI